MEEDMYLVKAIEQQENTGKSKTVFISAHEIF